MMLVVLFLLGIGNFAVHKAVLESGHPALAVVPPPLRRRAGQATLIAEFVFLLGALLLAAAGHSRWGLAYIVYSAVNGLSGWLILARRV